MSDLQKYKVKLVPMEKIKPSPENDELYGEIFYDEQMRRLIDSIEKRGLGDPLLLTKDWYILSGHRRHYALDLMGKLLAPCYISDIRREGNSEFHSALAEYNPQRVKSIGSILKEALLRDQSPKDTYAAIEEYHEASCRVEVDFMEVPGKKKAKTISARRKPFLEAVQKVVEDLKEYWGISVRQIHYNLLNDPPLKQRPKQSKYGPEHHRYRNDKESYQALVKLLTDARYLNYIPFEALDDPTRPEVLHGGWCSVDEYVKDELEDFLTGYHRDRQMEQPRHIEILGEKNTLMAILKKAVCEYYVPLTIGRGFSGPSIWKKMVARFKRSGKKSMTLIIVSDYDPEGFALADDAIRSLRDMWEIPIDYHRVGVTREQIDELGLEGDFNPAKENSNNLKAFIKRTGGKETWECEALPPEYLIDQVKAAIEANMDMDLFNEIVEREEDDSEQLYEVKRSIAGELEFEVD